MDDTPSITRTRHTALAPFRATAAQVRAGGIGALATLVAVLFRRPDLLVLATPLLVVATWGLATRPSEPVAVHTRLGRSTLAEGEATRWTLEADAPPGCDLVAVRLVEAEQLQIEPRRGFLMAATPPGAGSVTSTCDVRPIRWGVHAVGPAIVTMLSPWGAFRIPPAQLLPHALTALPGQTPLDLRGPTPHPHGLIGVHRSRRTGSGTEFDMIRAFHPGDRLRRIHWPSSTRTGHLHVSST